MMNKKILLSIIAVLTITVALFTGCSGKKVDKEGEEKKNVETITIKKEFDNIDYHVVTLNYDKGIKLETEDGTYGYIVKNEKADYEMNILINEDTTYADNKDYAKENNEGFKEEKFGKYKGYSYADSETEQAVYVLFEDKDGQSIYASIDISSISGDSKGSKLYASEEVQNILKTIEYKGTEKVVYENPDLYESRLVSVKKFDVDTKGYDMEFVRNVDDNYIDIYLKKGEEFVATISIMSLTDDEDKKRTEDNYKDPKECKKSEVKIGGVAVTKYQHLERAFGYDKSDVLLYEKDGKWMFVHPCYNKDVDEKLVYTIVEKLMENSTPVELKN